MTLTDAALREQALRLVNDLKLLPGPYMLVGNRNDVEAHIALVLIALRDALARAEVIAVDKLQAELIATMPGRRCVRPDHNGGEGSEGRVYGFMCGGCAFELAQEEADAARTEQREVDAKIAEEQEVPAGMVEGGLCTQHAWDIAAAIRAQGA